MIRAKLVLRNVIRKPLRSAIIILSLAAAAFATLFCISGINSAQNSLRDFFSSRYGDLDMMIISQNGVYDVKEEELPSGSHLFTQSITSVDICVPNERFYNYVDKYSFAVIGSDTALGNELKMYEKAYPTKDGVTMTAPLAAQLGKKVGDTISFFGSDGEEFELKILDIVLPTRSLSNTQNAILTTAELCNTIAGYADDNITMMFADIPEDKIPETTEKLAKDHPMLICVSTASNDSDEAMASMLSIYYLIFAVVFLMVCFIVVSMSNHIINERMSVIGMLRSIGGSIAGTGMLLLSESAFYGLCGGVLGTLLFLPMRNSTDIGFFAVAGGDYTKSDGITPLTIALVILGVILLECLFSASAIIRAAKTPVRDIIFGTKETAYIPSKLLTTVGAVLLISGIVLFVLFNEFTTLIAAAFCSAIGAVLIFPMVIRLISKLLAALFGGLNMPVAKLAVKEMATKKSSISSAQLILSAISLTISVFIIGASTIYFFTDPAYDSEIIITSPTQEGVFYRNVLAGLDGVEDVECIKYAMLSYEDRSLVNGQEQDLLMYALNDGGFEYFKGIENCPDKLADNEIAIDKVLASRLSLDIGDEMTIDLRRDKYLPVKLKMKIKSFIDGSASNNVRNTVLINDKVYSSIYFDNVAQVLVKTRPGMMYSVAEMMRATLPENDNEILTIEDYQQQQQENASSLLTLIYAVIALGFILSLMGTSSNILMGFEQSRRKYAVYYSSSLSKSGLRKLIVLESVFISGVSVAASVVFGLFFLQMITNALDLMNISVKIFSPLGYALIVGAGAFLLLLTVSIRPVMLLSKMNIAEEIKTGAD